MEATRAAIGEDEANSWLPFTGRDDLKEAVAAYIERRGGPRYDGRREIVITSGEGDAMLDALFCLTAARVRRRGGHLRRQLLDDGLGLCVRRDVHGLLGAAADANADVLLGRRQPARELPVPQDADVLAACATTRSNSRRRASRIAS
jgi:hypothetical protein